MHCRAASCIAWWWRPAAGRSARHRGRGLRSDSLVPTHRASGDELDEQDLQALWQRAEGPYAPLASPAAVVPLAERLAAERRDQARESPPAVEGSGQLAFDLAA